MVCDTAPLEPREKIKCLKGNFWGKSNSVNSYRVEQLGVCAIHHLVATLTSFYSVETAPPRSGVTTWGPNFQETKWKIRPRASCADVLRNIRNTRNRIKATVKYDHVDGPMDKCLLLTQVNLEQ